MVPRKLLCSAVAVAVTLGIITAPAQAARPAFNAQNAIGNLVAALVNVQTGDIVVVDASNVLRGADIDILNNALNNLNLDIALDLNVGDVLSDNDIDILNDLNIDIDDLIDIGVVEIIDDVVVVVNDIVIGVNVLGGQFILVE